FPDKKLTATLKRDPAISAYLPYIQALKRRADRVLSAGEEQLLSLAGDNLWAQIDLNELPSAMEKTYLALTSELILPTVVTPEGKDVQLSFTNYGVLRRSPDRNMRKQTVTAMLSTMKHYENTFAAALGEQAKFSWFLSRARGYTSVLEAYLDKDDIDPAIYTNLIRTVRAHVEPLHKYVALRKTVLELDDLHLYDMSVPMVASQSAEMDYNQGSALILRALAPLGEEYINLLKFGMDPANGWIDVYPAKDKERGAYSSAAYGVHPYVLMNFQNDLDDVSTLAHEYGHALHTHYASSSQSYQLFRYVPLLAEIASTCNEALLARYVIDHASSKDEKIRQLTELLETIRTTIYRQTMFAEFELKLHQLAESGEAINAEVLNSIYIDLVRSYFGPNYTIDEHDGIEWALVPHFYYKYYVYTYATGLAAGIAFADRILHEGPEARDAYLNMLKAGCSQPPLELVRQAGVDLTNPQAIESALKWFDEVVDELSEMMVD
ncbi:MAG: oligoendopeptidase F family protein, partial [Calditrichaeota bacterium]